MLFLTCIYIVDTAINKVKLHCNNWKRLYKVLNLAIGHGLAYACMCNINCLQNWSAWQPNRAMKCLYKCLYNVRLAQTVNYISSLLSEWKLACFHTGMFHLGLIPSFCIALWLL